MKPAHPPCWVWGRSRPGSGLARLALLVPVLGFLRLRGGAWAPSRTLALPGDGEGLGSAGGGLLGSPADSSRFRACVSRPLARPSSCFWAAFLLLLKPPGDTTEILPRQQERALHVGEPSQLATALRPPGPDLAFRCPQCTARDSFSSARSGLLPQPMSRNGQPPEPAEPVSHSRRRRATVSRETGSDKRPEIAGRRLTTSEGTSKVSLQWLRPSSGPRFLPI